MKKTTFTFLFPRSYEYAVVELKECDWNFLSFTHYYYMKACASIKITAALRYMLYCALGSSQTFAMPTRTSGARK
jgi:hypothetical protein